MNKINKNQSSQSAFTIIELLVVIAIVGVLATISIVGYGAWRKSVLSAQVKSDLNAAASAMESARTFNNSYPLTLPTTVSASDGVSLGNSVSADGKVYCVDGSSTEDVSIAYYIDNSISEKGAQVGTCAARPATAPPAVPTGLAVTSITATQIGLSWVAASGATGYNLQCASDAAFVSGLQQTSVGLATSGTVTGLQGVNTHYCKIKATNSFGNSAFTAPVTADTSTYQPPTGLAVTSVDNVSITFTWTGNVDATSYNVQCASNAGFTTDVHQVNTTSTNATVTGLTAYVQYFCHANATNTIGVSAWTSTVTQTTTATFGTIAAATNLSEVSPGPAAGDFSWTGITCSLGTPYYRFVWVSPQTSATAWNTFTGANGLTYPQQTSNTWKVQTKCTYSGLDSSITDSSSKSFTSVGVATPTGAWGTIGWDDRWTFNANSNTFTCVSPAVEEYTIVKTLNDATSGTWTYAWSTATSQSVSSNTNQGAHITTYLQVRCSIGATTSTVLSSTPRTDNASVDAPGYVPGWCYGTCGSPRGDRWSAVGCPAGTYAVYWSYAVGDYSNVIYGPGESANYYGYDRGYYNYGNTMVNDYLMARCTSSYRTSGWGPQAYARY